MSTKQLETKKRYPFQSMPPSETAAGWSKVIAAGFLRKASVAIAIANTPQSSPPDCLLISTNSVDIEVGKRFKIMLLVVESSV